MKRKTYLTSVICLFAAAAIALFFVLFAPRPIVKMAHDLTNADVFYHGKDITEKISADQLAEILSSGMCKRTIKAYFPRNLDGIVWEINAISNRKPMHILLGDINIWYMSADGAIYEILDAADLSSSLEALASQSQ